MAGLIAMHACILLAIGPLGHNANTVVWPWNIAMILFLLLLFRHGDPSASEILWGSTRFHRMALALLGLAPALSFFNVWDSYLSAALYSAIRIRARFTLSEWASRNICRMKWTTT